MRLEAFADLRELLKRGMGKSLASLLIKVLTAGLTYGMFVVLARVMSEHEYGYFAFGLSLATVLAIGAGMGQQTAVLRFWPEAKVAGRTDDAVGSLRSGAAVTLIGGAAVTLLLLLAIFAAHLTQDVSVHLYAAAALVLPLAASEYFSSALRAQGSVWSALTPRDLGWRLGVPLVAVALLQLGIVIDGTGALLVSAGLLVLAIGAQFALARWRGYHIAPAASELKPYWRERGRASRWFLAGTLIDSAALNADIIFVGIFLGPDAAGLYFNAFRTAGLITLLMYAMELVIAPMVAEHYHAGDLRKAQAVTALCAWAGFLFSLCVFAGFVVFGDWILALFGHPHPEAYWVLVLLGLGLVFDAATGPSRIVMMMTGHERDYVRIFGSIMLLGLALQLVVVPFYGVIAAAGVNLLSRAVAQVALAIWARRHIGLDTSVLGVAMINRQPRAVPAL